MSLVRAGTRTLVIALDGLGDLVLRQPLLSALADAGADVTVLVQAGHEEAVALVEPRARPWPAALEWTCVPTVGGFSALVDELRGLDPQLLVSAQFDPVCYADALVRAWPSVPAAGFAGGTRQDVPGWPALEVALGQPPAAPLALAVACAPEMHEYEKARALAQALTGRTWNRERPALRTSEHWARTAQDALQRIGLADEPFIACCPAGIKNVTIKAWPAERFAQVLAGAALEHGLPSLVLGHETEAQRVEEVVARARSAGARAEAWLGSRGELGTLAALLALSRTYLGNDTGAMHVAAGLSRPVIAVCGGGHWPRFVPLAVEGAAHTVPLPCFGCGWRECFPGEGPCVSTVPVASVQASLRDVLRGDAPFAIRNEAPASPDLRWDRASTGLRARASARRLQHQTGPAADPDEVLVSVVTPCLNGAATLEETLLSVRSQTHPALEHLVVDGGSTDGTLDLLARTPGVLWTSGADAGMYEAINRGFRIAAGDVLAYQNSDDAYSGPGAVASVVDAFRAHPEIDVIYGDFEYVDEGGRPLEVVRAPEFSLGALRRYNLVPPHSTFVRRRVVHERGLWLDPSLRYAGDWDWFLRMAIAGCTFLHLPRVLSRFRRRSGALSATVGFREKLREWRIICRNTGTPLLPLILNESGWVPLQRRLRRNP